MDKIAATRLETNSDEERRKPRKLVNFPLVLCARMTLQCSHVQLHGFDE